MGRFLHCQEKNPDLQPQISSAHFDRIFPISAPRPHPPLAARPRTPRTVSPRLPPGCLTIPALGRSRSPRFPLPLGVRRTRGTRSQRRTARAERNARPRSPRPRPAPHPAARPPSAGPARRRLASPGGRRSLPHTAPAKPRGGAGRPAAPPQRRAAAAGEPRAGAERRRGQHRLPTQGGGGSQAEREDRRSRNQNVLNNLTLFLCFSSFKSKTYYCGLEEADTPLTCTDRDYCRRVRNTNDN